MPSFDEQQCYDVVVVGGGLAGCCAAIQAARLGCRTVLLEKDPLLGGNGGPLLGVHISGAHSFHPYASEMGLIGEIIEEAAWQRAKVRTLGQHYNLSPQFETLLRDKLMAAGVQVYRRTYARDAEWTPDGDRRRITAVIAEDTARMKTVRFEVGTAVIDGSGDGQIAWRAGASFRRGREAQSETGERSAPPVADPFTMGNSVTALARRDSRAVEFIPPPGTPSFEPGYGRGDDTGPDGRRRIHLSTWGPQADFCFLWVTETGGQLDTIEDDHRIYDDLQAQVYSAWAALKAEHPEAANWELTWISPKAGKRESRRFTGDVVVTQTDVESGRVWADAVCFGGYSVDIHNPAGPDLKQVDIVFYSIPPLWSMPYRALYSRDVSNLYLAGRLASVTHLGLGSWRLMRTLGAGGQAVGVAAALSRRYGCDNRAIHAEHLDELQQTILRLDGAIPHVPHHDPRDLARQATITAASETVHGVTNADDWLPLDRPRGVQLWDWAERLDRVRLYLMNERDAPATVHLEVSQHQPDHPWKGEHERIGFPYEPVGNRMEWGADNRLALFAPLGSAELTLPAQWVGWVEVPLGLTPAPADPYSDEPRLNLALDAAPGVSWAVGRARYPFARRLERTAAAESWSAAGDAHLFSLDPAPAYGEAVNVINGWNRRWSTNPLHAWQAAETGEQWLQLAWPAAVDLAELRVTFDTLTRAYQEMPFDCEQRVSPMCVRDYRWEVRGADGGWQTVATERDNYSRLRVHCLTPCRVTAARLVVERVWDETIRARVYEVRAYGPDASQAGERTERG